eukprot:CAMPEP_0198266430 /NCGR_PEP_ID=MMETSP1447-20131203/28193_1 /TAXON_ID=420782 /ORGANISM="Chaetoceros dichaeta, Strain CCMP1751" /LENGTH=295 /DNA_ID=CAMNT_0043956463 /DNA_START=40 /DNA_END=924 /DNA_ORIENTATION=+
MLSSATTGVTKRKNIISKKKSHQKRKMKRKRYVHESFLMTYMKVAGILACICTILYVLYTGPSTILGLRGSSSSSNSGTSDSDNAFDQYQREKEIKEEMQGLAAIKKQEEYDRKPKDLPRFDLGTGSGASTDAWGIADRLFTGLDSSVLQAPIRVPATSFTFILQEFISHALEIKRDFASMCGGENQARGIMQHALATFQREDNQTKSTNTNNDDTQFIQSIPPNIHHTAKRILHAIQTSQPFHISFSGSSAAAGYGNYANQTFPYILANTLTDLFSTLNVDLVVRQAAIGGTME